MSLRLKFLGSLIVFGLVMTSARAAPPTLKQLLVNGSNETINAQVVEWKFDIEERTPVGQSEHKLSVDLQLYIDSERNSYLFQNFYRTSARAASALLGRTQKRNFIKGLHEKRKLNLESDLFYAVTFYLLLNQPRALERYIAYFNGESRSKGEMTLMKRGDHFYYLAYYPQTQLYFDNQDHQLLELIARDQARGVRIDFVGYTKFFEEYALPSSLVWKSANEKIYRIHTQSLDHYRLKSENFAKALAQAQDRVQSWATQAPDAAKGDLLNSIPFISY